MQCRIARDVGNRGAKGVLVNLGLDRCSGLGEFDRYVVTELESDILDNGLCELDQVYPAALLAVVQAFVTRPMILLERFLPGGGWWQAAALAFYAGWLADRLREAPRRVRDAAREIRRRASAFMREPTIASAAWSANAVRRRKCDSPKAPRSTRLST